MLNQNVGESQRVSPMVESIVISAEGVLLCLKKGGIKQMQEMKFCNCHKTDWHEEVYADEKGRCKWCGKPLRKFWRSS